MRTNVILQLPGKILLESGKPVDVIVNAANHEQAGLIVTHRGAALGRGAVWCLRLPRPAVYAVCCRGSVLLCLAP